MLSTICLHLVFLPILRKVQKIAYITYGQTDFQKALHNLTVQDKNWDKKQKPVLICCPFLCSPSLPNQVFGSAPYKSLLCYLIIYVFVLYNILSMTKFTLKILSLSLHIYGYIHINTCMYYGYTYTDILIYNFMIILYTYMYIMY